MLKDADVKQRIELTITGIGIIIFIFLIISYMPKSRDKRVVLKIEPYSASKVAMAAASEVKSWGNTRWGRDPFLLDASNVKEQGMEDLSLNGIVSDMENPYAIINNEVIKLGDTVNGMTVIEINEKSVVLEQDGQKHTLELNIY